MRNNCLNCSNAVGKDFCTMQKDMNLAMYKKCKFHKILPKRLKPKPLPATKRRITNVLPDEECLPDFLKFVRNGGFWSFRTGDNKIP